MNDSGFAIALALSTAAGLRPSMTLAAAAIAVHVGTFHPSAQFAFLGTDGVVTLLVVLTVVEFLADKIPLVDHCLHVIHFAWKPLAAALVAGGTITVNDPTGAAHAALMVAVAANAFGLHFFSATARALSTSFTLGIANPFVSLLEDIAAVVVLIIALLSPFLGLVITIAGIVFMCKTARLARQMLHKRVLSAQHM